MVEQEFLKLHVAGSIPALGSNTQPISTQRIAVPVKQNDRIRNYAAQKGVETKGAFKSNSTKEKLCKKLTHKQRRRLKKKVGL